MDLMSCPGMAVPLEVMHHVVRVESSYNPYAIGVVGGRLVRQPKSLPEALATVQMLETKGYNFSLGLAQVNRYNLAKYGLDSYERAFQVCANLQAGSRILAECYGRSGGNWGKSFSCYYSGDFQTGFRHGYVEKIYASMRRSIPGVGFQPGVPAIAVVGQPVTRAPSARFPLYGSPQGTPTPRIVVEHAPLNTAAPTQQSPAAVTAMSAAKRKVFDAADIEAPPAAPPLRDVIMATRSDKPSAASSEPTMGLEGSALPDIDPNAVVHLADLQRPRQTPDAEVSGGAHAVSGDVADGAFVF